MPKNSHRPGNLPSAIASLSAITPSSYMLRSACASGRA